MNTLPLKYRDAVVNNDVMVVLRDLPPDCVDVIYGDPDYNEGVEYAGRSYTGSWDEYIEWYGGLTRECLRVLKPDGNAFFINYPKQNAHLRVKHLDEQAWAVHEYVWVYNTNIGHSPYRFTPAHRSILHATKSRHNRFYKDQVAQPYQNPTDPRILQRLRDGSQGRMPYSWLYFDLVKNVSRNKTTHPCQIPDGLSRLLLRSCTQPGDNAFILFGGSGSEVVQAKDLELTYLTCEIQQSYCEIIHSRLANGGDVDSNYRHPAGMRNVNGLLPGFTLQEGSEKAHKP